MSLDRIPDEMKAYAQWVVWRLENHGDPKPRKVPYSPRFATHAAVNNPASWATFDEAAVCGPFLPYDLDPNSPNVVQPSGRTPDGKPLFPSPMNTGVHGIGFVLTNDDPFGFVDLDDTKGDEELLQRQYRIFGAFQSYSERSPSGTGLHIIVQGRVDRGRKRASIEVYSSDRYMTMTGDVYRDAPIVDCQEQFSLLWHQMGGPAQIHQYGGDQEQKDEDDVILERAFNAVNGDKFRQLWEGRWQDLYSSQSEADFALVDIVAFYTQNRAQIARLFLRSGLGVRDKAKRRDYQTYMINKAFDRQLPPVDIEGLRVQFDNMLNGNNEEQYALPGFIELNGHVVPIENGAAEGPAAPLPYGTAAMPSAGSASPGRDASRASGEVAQEPPAVNDKSTIIFPPGLVGEVAQFIYDAAPRPVHEIALVAAIGFVAGIVGRAYNVSATGLNVYALLLAPTGTGKEAINHGISKLVTAARQNAPTIIDFVGPGEVRSDAALIKWLAKNPCCYSIVGEFGMRLKQMSAPNANSNEIGVKRVLMDLFNKSGHGNILNPMAYSDKDKNTVAIVAPSYTMIGETTPERFYEALDEQMIADGLLPRFLSISYDGKRPALSETAMNAQPSFALVEMVKAIVVHCLKVASDNSVVNVRLSPEADRLMRDFDRFCDSQINAEGVREVTRHMWNRAHIKALKIAALVAVGVYPYEPMIDFDAAKWATDLVVRDVENIIGRFERGEVGQSAFGVNERKQIDDMVRVIRDWLKGDGTEAAKYGMPVNMQRDGVVLASALTKRLFAMASFRNDRTGSSNAVKRTLQHLLDGDEIREIPKTQMANRYNTTARAFVIARAETFA